MLASRPSLVQLDCPPCVPTALVQLPLLSILPILIVFSSSRPHS